MEQENNKKVLAMYQAVWELIEEGADIYRLKVADITARAGIGKGTAYEYFKSKEELLGRALLYESKMELERLKARVKEQPTMKDALRCCFAWLEEGRDKCARIMRFAQAAPAFQDTDWTGNPVGCMEEQIGQKAEQLLQIIDAVIEKGWEEGLISKNIPVKLVRLQILSAGFGFFTFLQMGSPESQKEIVETKEFLYGGIIKSLHGDTIRK